LLALTLSSVGCLLLSCVTSNGAGGGGRELAVLSSLLTLRGDLLALLRNRDTGRRSSDALGLIRRNALLGGSLRLSLALCTGLCLRRSLRLLALRRRLALNSTCYTSVQCLCSSQVVSTPACC
jgi:hypothetical protein